MSKGWHKQTREIDVLLNKLANSLTVLMALENEEFTYHRCCSIHRFARHLDNLVLRNTRMRRK